MVEIDTKLLEILVGVAEEEIYNAEYFAVEENRRKLDVTGRKIEGEMMPAAGAEGQNYIGDSHA
jgi:tRNA(Ser,Leu) C12 N-acetylase TAN1